MKSSICHCPKFNIIQVTSNVTMEAWTMEEIIPFSIGSIRLGVFLFISNSRHLSPQHLFDNKGLYTKQ